MLEQFYRFNDEQLTELAKFCFDVAKAGAVSFFLPAVFPQSGVDLAVGAIRSGLVMLISLYFGLLLLKLKEVMLDV